MNNKLTELQKIIREKNLDGFIVTNSTNIFYLTGFRGVMPQEREAILIVTLTGAILVTARLYQNEAAKVVSHQLKIKIVDERNQIFQTIKKLLKNTEKVGFEESDLKYSEYQEFKKALSNLGLGPTLKKLIPFRNLIEDLRAVKTATEIAKIEKAQIISQKAFEILIKTIKIGQTEEEIAQNLASIIKNLGGQSLAFESIIASGPNSGKPHHLTSNRRLTKNDILLFDFGAKYQDYCADLSRTIFVGHASDRFKNIFGHVQKAQKLALEDITHSRISSHPYQQVVNHFKKRKLDQYFLHGLGHGIGLEVHEKPHLRPSTTQARLGQGRQAGLVVPGQDEEVLTENMVFSIEPGLYLPWGGIRIEDLVVIQNGKAKVLGQTIDGIIEI